MPTRAYARYGAPSADPDRELLAKHAGLLDRCARRLAARTGGAVQADDLWSAGALGLLEAARRFEATRDVRFETFAEHRIRGAMLDEMRRVDRVPRSVRRKTRRIGDVATSLATLLGREPNHEELAGGLGVDMETLWRWQAERESTQLISLERASSTTASGRGTDEWLAGCPGDELDEMLTLDAEATRLREAILALPEQERTVLSLYYFEDLKLNDIARILGVSESRISQVRSKAIHRLRRALARLRAPVA
jgi:RNA polymerase sigma factor for flagellar operon FliA